MGGLACLSKMTGNIQLAVNLVGRCSSAKAAGCNVRPDWEKR